MRREVREELGEVGLGTLVFLGDYIAPAALAGQTVRVELFSGDLEGEPSAAAEIRELFWFGADDDPALLAPSLGDLIFPELVWRGLLWV